MRSMYSSRVAIKVRMYVLYYFVNHLTNFSGAAPIGLYIYIFRFKSYLLTRVARIENTRG